MSKNNKDMINTMSGLDYDKIERLDQISQTLLGKSINDIKTMNDLWNDFTYYSKKGNKQKEWENVGSDVIMEQWAAEFSGDLYEALGFIQTSKGYKEEGSNQFKPFTQEELDMYQALVNEADEILGTIIS